MPDLRWDKTDLLECFGVLPEADEHETCLEYTVARSGLVLAITLWQYECVLDIRLRRNDRVENLIAFSLMLGGVIEYKREKWGDYLRLPACRVGVDSYHLRKAGADSTNQATLLDVEIAVDPDIRITFN